MTTRSSQALACTLANKDGKVQMVVWTHKPEGSEHPIIGAWYRTAPSATTPKPRWSNIDVVPSLWPGRGSSALRGAVGTVQGYLSRKLTSEGPYTVEGMWALDFTDEEHKQLDLSISADANERDKAELNSLKTRVSRLFEGSPPRTASYESINAFAEWLLSGPVVALPEGGKAVAQYTESVLKGPSGTLHAMSEETAKAGIPLTDGKTTFIPRKIWSGTMTDVDFLLNARANEVYALLVGPPGTGKSALVEAAFIDAYVSAGMIFKDDALIVGTEDTTVTDIIGGMVQDPATGIYHFRPGKAIRCAEAGVPLFIDEALLIDPRVLSVVYSLIDGRGVLPLPPEFGYVSPEGHKDAVYAKEGFYIVFAGNPHVPGAVISEALASRCVLKPEYLTDYDTVSTLIGPSHDEIVAVSRNMETKRRNGEVTWAPQMRDLLGYAKTASIFGTEMALSNLLANCESESDREVLADVIRRVMGVTNIREFTL